ncbi:MAG: MBL fold metallo-hydrolase [Eubacterium sp.]|nr:MBL fold metallo-hydrolase [Eubacterium sp.]
MTKDIELFTQNSIKIMEGDRRIYIDPFQMRREPQNADFILITHDHYDHFSPKDIAKVASPSTVLVVPETMAEKAKEVESLVAKICTVRPGEEYVFDGLRLETVAAYNIGKAFHPKEAGWVGYIVIIAGQRIYIAGDTDETAEALDVICDIAMVPVGGTYTMDAREAARLVNNIKPKAAIPTHYGNSVSSKSAAETFREHVDLSIKVEIKMLY